LRETLIVKFEVTGSLRFCSHQEMMRVWHRALIRAKVPISFSEGFNPHPRISLPLPRSVGLEAAGELACVCVERPEEEPLDVDRLRTRISEELPLGCTLSEIALHGGRASFHAQGAVYFLPVRPSEKLRNAVDTLLARLAASEKITVQRRVNDRGSCRVVEVGEYIESIEINDNGVLARCRIRPAGSIRVDEIMSLLQIDVSMLTGAVARMSVQWAKKN
jgi:radical SAM-linked protein